MGCSTEQKTVKGLRWVGVSVRDLAAPTKFYSHAVALQEVARGEWADPGSRPARVH
jgi:hypothetical protein